MPESVCALVVTYNRKDLLRECLQALQSQSRPLERIYVINNASTDGTADMLGVDYPEVFVVDMPENLGGAGGFHRGIETARDEGFDWMWIMDDDSVPSNDALERLLVAADAVTGLAPAILASKVVWTDGGLHPMNKPILKTEDKEHLFALAERRMLPIRSASFVSILLRRPVVEKYGLPFADYFIWNDDVEYTARILKKDTGWWVADSVVVHKTVTKKVVADDIRISRYYYSIRNRIWMVKNSNAWWFRERLGILKSVIGIIWYLLRNGRARGGGMKLIVSGVWDGVTGSPKK